MSWNILLLSLGHLPGCALPTLNLFLGGGGHGEWETKALMLCRHCSSIAKTSVCYHHSVVTNRTKAPMSCHEDTKVHSSQDQYRENGGKDGNHCLVETCLQLRDTSTVGACPSPPDYKQESAEHPTLDFWVVKESESCISLFCHPPYE